MNDNNISGIKGHIMKVYGAIIDVIVVFLILVMLVTVGVAFIGVLYDLYQALSNLRHEVAIQTLVISILSVFVLIELFRSFTDYLEFHRIRLRVLTEVAIVFILRDIFIGLYSRNLQWQDVMALGFLLGVLIAGRILAILYSPETAAARSSSP